MAGKVLRQIIEIDESRCNGCGLCIDSCVEGALALVDGKARLVKDQYCDGLAACLKECPQGALKIVERQAEAFDARAAVANLATAGQNKDAGGCNCPGSAVRQFPQAVAEQPCAGKQPSALSHWPVQLSLVPPGAAFLQDSDVLLTAQCVPVVYPNLHRDFLGGHSIMIACPKLDDAAVHLNRLTAILRQTAIRSLTILRTEVPCCSGLSRIARQALALSGKNMPFREVVISINGEVKDGIQAK